VIVEVVAGVLVRDRRIFLQQRPPTKDFGLCWESPGGKVEPGESHRVALRRELLEELGVGVDLLAGQRAIWSGRFENLVSRPDRATIALHFYFIGDRFSGEPRILDGQPGVGWFSGVEMMALNLAPANQRAKVVLVELMRREE
jgi:8-oxo-dGTP diphosphatase